MLFRVAGKGSLTEITPFDLVLLLVFSEAVQQPLIDDDCSPTNRFLLILTLVTMNSGLSLLWKRRSSRLDRLLDDVPLIVVEDGRPLKDRMDKARIDETDVMQAARQLQGLERMDQIKYAVLERSGGISIIPKQAG